MTEFFGEQSHNDDWGAGYSAGQAGINKAITTAALLERQRIIKLLTDHFQHRDLNGIRLDNFHNNSLDEAIELIKGEK